MTDHRKLTTTASNRGFPRSHRWNKVFSIAALITSYHFGNVQYRRFYFRAPYSRILICKLRLHIVVRNYIYGCPRYDFLPPAYLISSFTWWSLTSLNLRKTMIRRDCHNIKTHSRVINRTKLLHARRQCAAMIFPDTSQSIINAIPLRSLQFVRKPNHIGHLQS